MSGDRGVGFHCLKGEANEAAVSSAELILLKGVQIGARLPVVSQRRDRTCSRRRQDLIETQAVAKISTTDHMHIRNYQKIAYQQHEMEDAYMRVVEENGRVEQLSRAETCRDGEVGEGRRWRRDGQAGRLRGLELGHPGPAPSVEPPWRPLHVAGARP